MITFGVATGLEVFAYYIPFVDNMLDVVAAPAAAICGSLLMGSTIVEIDPLIKWTVSVIAGGGLATAVQGSTSIIRAKSSSLTGGMGNPIVSALETTVSGLISIVSIVIPIAVIGILSYLTYKILGKRLFKRSSI